MTKPVKEKKDTGLVVTTVPARSSLRTKKLERIITKLYVAIAQGRGLYKYVTMETHAPQRMFYPGAPSVQPKKVEVSPQTSFITTEDDGANNIHPKKKIEIDQKQREVLSPSTLEHRRWLWFATLTDRREDSMKVYRAHCDIYHDHSEFYDERILQANPETIKELLKKKINDKNKYTIGSPAQSATYWQVCARTLYEMFDGDPVILLKSCGWSVPGVIAWKKQSKKPVDKGGLGYDPIPGWGPKLVSLYFLYLAELGFTLPSDAFASDVHWQAIIMQVGGFDYVDKESVSSTKLAEMSRPFVTDVCNRKDYETLLLAHASWLLGSTLCSNGCSKRVDAPILCPIYEECGGRIDTSHYWKKGKWPKGLPMMNKGGERPPYGIPTDVTRRLSQRAQAKVIPIIPLFPKRT